MSWCEWYGWNNPPCLKTIVTVEVADVDLRQAEVKQRPVSG